MPLPPVFQPTGPTEKYLLGYNFVGYGLILVVFSSNSVERFAVEGTAGSPPEVDTGRKVNPNSTHCHGCGNGHLKRVLAGLSGEDFTEAAGMVGIPSIHFYPLWQGSKTEGG